MIIRDYYDVIFHGLEKESGRVDYFLQLIEQKEGVCNGVYDKYLSFTEDEFFRECRKVIAEYKLNIELQHEGDLLEAKIMYYRFRLAYELPDYGTEGKEMIREYLEEMKDRVAKLEERGWQTSGWCHRLSFLWQSSLDDEWEKRMNCMQNADSGYNWRESTRKFADGKRIFYTQIIELEKAINEAERMVTNKPLSSSSEVQDVQEIEKQVIIENENNTQDKETDFADFLHHDNKDALLEKLRDLINDKTKPKDTAITIQALLNLSFLANYGTKGVLYDAMRKKFNMKGTDSAFNDILNPKKNKISDKDTKPIEDILLAIK
jgi:hypothetical protein